MGRNGILCLEGDWEDGLRRERSLLPVLTLIGSQWDIPFIHRTASTREEFRSVVREWSKSRYSRYPILYLGFHGYFGAIEIGTEFIPIGDLAELAGKGDGRIIHFGACETLQCPHASIRRFFKLTRFVAISGFCRPVDWLHSCALEILILDELSRRRITVANIRAFKKRIARIAGSLSRELGFSVWERSLLRR